MTLDAATFIETCLVNPETKQLFVLTEAERAYLRHAFDLTPDGRLLYPELLFSAPKKSGKTAFGAMILLYVVRALGGRYAEGYCISNDFEQAQGRVYQAAARIIEASPMLAADAIVTQSKISFISTGATIVALASDYASAAGANPSITVFDELWAYTSERSHRLFDEMVPPPTRAVSCRLTVTYAGYEGESDLLADLYKRGLAGDKVAPDLWRQPGLLMFWTNEFTAPWQTEEWRQQMRAQLRPNAYLRLIENRWVSGESSFVPIEWWDACVDPSAKPLFASNKLRVYLGIDASVKRDSTAVVAATYDRDAEKVRIVNHTIFQPSPSEPLNFESTVEALVEELDQRFKIIEARYDPYQMQASAQRLLAQRIPMVEYAQSVPNLTSASTNLYELLKSQTLVAYADDDMRLAVQRAVAVEMPRGWKISKASASHKIDVVVALGMAALGAVQEASRRPPMQIGPTVLERAHLPLGSWPVTPNPDRPPSPYRAAIQRFRQNGAGPSWAAGGLHLRRPR